MTLLRIARRAMVHGAARRGPARHPRFRAGRLSHAARCHHEDSRLAGAAGRVGEQRSPLAAHHDGGRAGNDHRGAGRADAVPRRPPLPDAAAAPHRFRRGADRVAQAGRRRRGDHDSRAGRRPSHAPAVEPRRQAPGLLRHDAGPHDAAHLRRHDQGGPRRHRTGGRSRDASPRRAAGRRTASTSCSAPRRARAKRSGSPTWTRRRRNGSRRPRSTTWPAAVRGRPGARLRVCLLFPEGRGAEPKTPEAPAGPIVQESYGRAVPARTNTYLLKDRHDEALLRLLHDVAARVGRARRKDHAARQARRPRAAVGVAGRQVPPRPHDPSSRTRIRWAWGTSR